MEIEYRLGLMMLTVRFYKLHAKRPNLLLHSTLNDSFVVTPTANNKATLFPLVCESIIPFTTGAHREHFPLPQPSVPLSMMIRHHYHSFLSLGPEPIRQSYPRPSSRRLHSWWNPPWRSQQLCHAQSSSLVNIYSEYCSFQYPQMESKRKEKA